MGYATCIAADREVDAPASAAAATHDMRPACEARVLSGLLTPGDAVGATGRLALLLVPFDGAPFGVRFGENIRAEVGVGPGAAMAVAAHTPLRIDLASPVHALRMEFDESLLRTAHVPLLGRLQGHYALQSGLALRPEAIVAVARLLAGDMVTDAGGFAFRSALALALIEHLAHDPALVRHRDEVASGFTGAGIERALQLIEQNLSVPISLEWLAAEAGISSYHLSRTFRRVTGSNINSHVRARRLKEACRLLSETRKPLAEIAYDCGFSSQSRMTTVFRQALDITPLAYRNQCWRAGERVAGKARA
jgi:AraC-like DNA-binding protein